MKQRLFHLLPFAPAVLGAVALFVLVGLSKQPWQGPGLPVPAPPCPVAEIVPPPPARFEDSSPFEYVNGLHPRVALHLWDRLPTELWASRLMRAERQMWKMLEAETPDPEARTLRELVSSFSRKSGWALCLDEALREDVPLRAANAGESLAGLLRRTADSAGLYVVPSEPEYSGLLTRNPRLAGWPRTWPLVRVLKALRGEVPDATERAWLALEGPPPTTPSGDVDVRTIENWLASATGLTTEFSEEARPRIESAPALRVPSPDEGDTIESCARVALVRAGLDVAARAGSVLICRRGEADALAAGRFLTREWTQREWKEGEALLATLDPRIVVIGGIQCRPAVLITRIADACTLEIAIDDITWDDPTLIALPKGEYTIRELREQLWVSASVRMHALKGRLWFVEPEPR
ncbi:MAG: hypothetical protein AAB074_19625 [Planctomycetota bacterium]